VLGCATANCACTGRWIQLVNDARIEIVVAGTHIRCAAITAGTEPVGPLAVRRCIGHRES